MTTPLTTKNFQIPFNLHGNLIGKGGEGIKKLESSYNVKVSIPDRNAKSSTVGIRGSSSDVEKARLALEKSLSFKIAETPLVQLKLEIAKNLHSRIIGKGGEELSRLQTETGSSIQIPDRNSKEEHVTVLGTSHACESAIQSLEMSLGVTINVVGREKKKVELPKKLDLTVADINEALFFPDKSEKNFNRFLEYLASPTKTLEVACFTLSDDRISNILASLHTQGIKVRIITDDETISNSGSDILSLRKMGIPIKRDFTKALFHHKFALLDGKVMLTGSFNWTRSAATQNFENILFSNNSKLVKEFRTAFEELWNSKDFVFVENK